MVHLWACKPVGRTETHLISKGQEIVVHIQSRKCLRYRLNSASSVRLAFARDLVVTLTLRVKLRRRISEVSTIFTGKEQNQFTFRYSWILGFADIAR